MKVHYLDNKRYVELGELLRLLATKNCNFIKEIINDDFAYSSLFDGYLAESDYNDKFEWYIDECVQEYYHGKFVIMTKNFDNPEYVKNVDENLLKPEYEFTKKDYQAMAFPSCEEAYRHVEILRKQGKETCVNRAENCLTDHDRRQILREIYKND